MAAAQLHLLHLELQLVVLVLQQNHLLQALASVTLYLRGDLKNRTRTTIASCKKVRVRTVLLQDSADSENRSDTSDRLISCNCSL